MKTISIDGVIGWDVFAADIRAQIRDAAGDDLTIELNSPGGSVTEGIAIFNAIKNASGKKTARLVGLAASMGSYIPLACDEVVAEKNAVYMIHNVQMIAVGDHNALRKSADVGEGLTKILASAYVAKTGKTAEEIRALMDGDKGADGSYFYGDEIKEAGFADSVDGEKSGDDKATAVIKTRAAVALADDLIKRLSTEKDIDNAAAMVAEFAPRSVAQHNEKNAGVAGAQAAGPKEKEGVKKMTTENVKAEAPEVAEALRNEGVQVERRRVAGLTAWKGISAEADKIVEETVANGKTYEDVASQLAAAAAKGKSAEPAGGDNPPAVPSANAQTASGATGLDELDREAMAIYGTAPADYQKFKKEAV